MKVRRHVLGDEDRDTLSISGAIPPMTALRACGPPVEAPIEEDARGTAGRGRSLTGAWPSLAASPPAPAGASFGARNGARSAGARGVASALPGSCARRGATGGAAPAEVADLLDDVATKFRRGRDVAVGFRLGDVVERAESEALQGDLGVPTRQRRGHDDRAIALLAQDQRQGRDAVHLGHLDVEDDHVGVRSLHVGDG